MRRIRATTTALLLILSGCSLPQEIPGTGSGTVNDFLRTASGYVIEGARQAALRLRSGQAIELGKMGLQKAASVAGNLQKRAGEFQEGVESMQKGKELIEKAVAE